MTGGNTVRFAEELDKLQYPVFPTIRDHAKYGVGDTMRVVVEETPGDQPFCYAVVAGRRVTRLRNVPDQVLRFDTGADTAAGAVDKLQEYYPDLDMNRVVVVYFLMKVGS